MTQVIELSGDAAGLLRAMDQSIAKEKDHERQLGETAAAGSAAGDVLESAMADVAKSNDKVFAGILKDLRRAGPEGREMAKALQSHFADAGKAGYRSIGTVIDQLREIDPEAAAAADKAQAELNSIDDTVDFDSTLGELRGLGGEAAKIAAGITADMKAADAEAAGDMNEILDRLKQIDPTVEQSANRVRQELAEAARFSEGKFEGTLDKLRSMGPVGKKVAEGLKADLVGAGELAEESIDDVIATLRKIDPAAADAAKGIYTNLDDSAKKSDVSFKTFGVSAIRQITAVAGAYVSIQKAIDTVTGYLQEQDRLMERSLNRQIQLASAQQEASKNLAGLTVVERDELLQQAVPDISSATGFSDLTQITTAIGAAVSRGADSELAANAVLQSARVELNTPDNLDETAGGAVALALQTGLKDIRQSIALIQTTGTQSAVVDPGNLIETVPKAVGSAVATVRKQDREEASREGAALYAVVTQAGNDDKGTSSATFVTDLTARMGKFFGEFENELIDARSKIQKIDTKIAKGSDTEADRRDRAQLAEFVKVGQQVQKDLAGTSAFETLSGRIETLQQNPELRQQFVGEGFGEKQFSTFLTDIFDANSRTAQSFNSSTEAIQANAEFFELQAQQIASGTPQLALSNFQNRAKAAEASQDYRLVEDDALKSLREESVKALADSRPGFASFVGDTLEEYSISSGATAGSTAAEEAVGIINTLKGRQNILRRDGLTEQEAVQSERLQGQIDASRELLERLAPRLAVGSLSAAAERASDVSAKLEGGGNRRDAKYFQDFARQLERLASSVEKQNDLAEKNLKASETTAANTKPKLQPIDTNAALRGSAALSDARADL